MAQDPFLTVREVAERLRMHPVTVQRWLRSGRLHGVRLPASKLGWRIRASEIERLLSELTDQREG